MSDDFECFQDMPLKPFDKGGVSCSRKRDRLLIKVWLIARVILSAAEYRAPFPAVR